MARNELRPVVKLRSTAGTGYTYVTRKNRRNDPDRLTLRKYDPIDALYRRYNPAYHQETVFVPEEDDGQAPVDVQSPP